MNASLVANQYSTRRNSRAVIAAHVSGKLTPTLEKIWNELSFLNDNTDGGFFKLRQALDKNDQKRASYYKYVNGQKVESGWMSQINGIVADTPDKIRGERCELLIFEEAGSWGGLRKAVVQGEALVNILGTRFGYKVIGGTGGDSGSELEGLRDIYTNPIDYSVLPFRHHFTPTGEETLSGYFLPAYSLVLSPGYMDDRGWCDPEKCKAFHEEQRLRLVNNPKAFIEYCAEYCFTAEEAFALEGNNKFNQINIADQLARIRVLKEGPKIEKGYFTFVYKDQKQRRLEGPNISGVQWHEDNKLGTVKIIEHPLWTLDRRDDDGNVLPKVQEENFLYVAGVDGIDIGQSQTSEYTKDPSQFCMVIYKRVRGLEDPQIVAIYKDRPQDIKEAYQSCIALAIYYNARINIEATRLSFVTWARDQKFLNWFMKRPRATYQDITKVKTSAYGTPATGLIIDHQTDLIAMFVNDYCYTIWFEEVLVELNQYSPENKRKFDIVAAFAMALLADEEYSGTPPKAVKVEEQIVQDIGYYYDEYGIKRYGVIPNNRQFKTQVSDSFESYDNFSHSSNPRYR